MLNEGWVIAARRRDGAAPSLVKAIGPVTFGATGPDGATVYHLRADAESALEALHDPEKVYGIFRVEVTVSSESA